MLVLDWQRPWIADAGAIRPHREVEKENWGKCVEGSAGRPAHPCRRSISSLARSAATIFSKSRSSGRCGSRAYQRKEGEVGAK
jgi:hypothetical protein